VQWEREVANTCRNNAKRNEHTHASEKRRTEENHMDHKKGKHKRGSKDVRETEQNFIKSEKVNVRWRWQVHQNAKKRNNVVNMT
jgi:hypothetical protein